MFDSSTPRGGEPAQPATRRLESWKEIASYLDRSPRTVRRWERDEGLPVHRHRHATGSTVFAHVDELERWLNSRVARSEARVLPDIERPKAIGQSGAIGRPPDETISTAHLAEQPRAVSVTALRWVAASSLLALVMAAVALVVGVSTDEPVESFESWIRSIPVEERLLLEASYFESRGDHEAALTALEGVVGIGPLGLDAVSAARRSCDALGAPERCARLVMRAADESPGHAVLQAMAARVAADGGDSFDAALVYADRARSTVAGEAALEPRATAFVNLLPARVAWLRGDVAGSAGELDRMSDLVGKLDVASRDAVSRGAGWHCLALGRIECASEWFGRVAGESERHELAAYTLFASGRMEELAAHLAAGSDYRLPETAVLLAMTGNPDAAEALLDGLGEGATDEGTLAVVRGGLDLLEGRPTDAGPRLEEGVATVRPEGSGAHFIGLDMMSRLAEAKGEAQRAAELLEMTNDQRERAALLGTGLFWIKCQTRLAEVYRNMGRPEDALRVERELLIALALSDPDHPTTAALKRRSI